MQKLLEKFIQNYTRRVEETHNFYNTEENGESKNPSQCIKNNRFLIYSHLLGYAWKPAFYGSAILSFFDNGEYNAHKLAAIALTSPALAAGTVLFGAFWSNLGTKKLLEESWRESKPKTIKKIIMGNLWGNIMHDYYKIRAASGVTQGTYDRACLNLIDRIGERNETLARGITEFGTKFSEFYFREVMLRI